MDRFIAALGWCGLVVAGAASPLRAQSVERISVDDSGNAGNADSGEPSLSDDGSRVAFSSFANNLVAGDGNFHGDVFVRDRAAATTTRASISTAGVEGDGNSFEPRISADGMFVVFASDATNLIASDTNKVTDVFLRDVAAGTTSRAGLTNGGGQPDGRCYGPVVSSDGRYVAFTSDATNLVSGDTNHAADVFLRDRQANTTIRISVKSSGAQANAASSRPAISRDGRYVAFASDATNLDPLDKDSFSDVYVRDTVAGTTTLVSVSSAGAKGKSNSRDPAISDDGRYVAFASAADDLVAGDGNFDMDVYVRDLVAGTTTCASVDSDGNIPSTIGLDTSEFAAISGDGHSVLFASLSDALVGGDANASADTFCHFDPLALTTRQSLASNFDEADRGVTFALPACSADASVVAFASKSTNLAPGTTTIVDVFLRERPAASAASWQNYGSGHPGTLGTPSLAVSAAPQLNQHVDLLIGNSCGSWTDALVLLGVQQVDWPTAWGGHLLVAPTAVILIALPPSGGAFAGRIPPDEALIGSTLNIQVLEIDVGASKYVSFTPGLELVFGY